MVDGKETSGGGAPTHSRSHHVGNYHLPGDSTRGPFFYALLVVSWRSLKPFRKKVTFAELLVVFLRTFGTKNWLERAPNCQGWNISFPSHKSSNLVAIATVQDTWKADKLIQEFSSFTFISPAYVLVPDTFNGLGNQKTFMCFSYF